MVGFGLAKAEPILLYFPNWFVVAAFGIYMGVVQPPVPSRHGGARFNRTRTLSYGELYDTYVNGADFWEKKIKSGRNRRYIMGDTMNSLQAGFYIPSTKHGYLQAPLCQGSSVPSRYIWIGWQRSGVYVDLQIKKGL